MPSAASPPTSAPSAMAPLNTPTNSEEAASRASGEASRIACSLIGVHGAAPEYWRRAQAPAATPGGVPIATGPSVSTLQEGLALVQADRGAMLLCHPTADYYGRRAVTFVPVTGLQDSSLALVWHRHHETARTRAFSQALAAVTDAG